MADSNTDNARTAYEFVAKAHDSTLAQRDRVSERANGTVLVIAVVFGALSYGAGNLWASPTLSF